MQALAKVYLNPAGYGKIEWPAEAFIPTSLRLLRDPAALYKLDEAAYVARSGPLVWPR